MMSRVLPLVLLIAAANLVMLASARGNRSGEADVIRLTERELRQEAATDRDSAVRLRLNYVGNVNWELRRNEPTMIALGFTCHPRTGLPVETGSCGLARRAFVALEYEGRAWQELVAHREAERDRAQANANYHSDYLDNLIKFGSRLVMIDASRDGIALRRAHPARNVIILPATARAWLTTDVRSPSGGAAMTGSITPLPTTLVVSARDRRQLLTLPASQYGFGGAPRFTVDLSVGSRHEPWVQNVQMIDQAGAAR